MHEARRLRVEFERETDQLARRCDWLAEGLRTHQLSEAEFDRRAKALLGDDYEPPGRSAI